MSAQVKVNEIVSNNLKADCENCFGLCCVALPFAKSADFAIDKDGGTPCKNLQADNRCSIHQNLRNKGFQGCAIYECFGAGQKVSQNTYKGLDWRDNPASAKEMYNVFPIMQQLHEMLTYLYEALRREETRDIFTDLQDAVQITEALTNQDPASILKLNVPEHRAVINKLLLKTSEAVRAKVKKTKNQHKIDRKSDLIGANLRGAKLKGSNLRGVLLIGADLREADVRFADLIGADLRDADLSGANLTGSIFLTQAQINSAKGDLRTKLPPSIKFPEHWLI